MTLWVLCTNPNCRHTTELPPFHSGPYACERCDARVLHCCLSCRTPLPDPPSEKSPYCMLCGLDLMSIRYGQPQASRLQRRFRRKPPVEKL